MNRRSLPLLCLLISAIALTAMADNTLRGKRLRVSTNALTGGTDAPAPADTLFHPANDIITLSGYDKPLTSAYEAFLLTNRAQARAERLALTITYYDLSGRQLHERSDTLPVAVPAGETRLVKIPTWDSQRSYYYHKGKRPRTANVTPYSIRARVDFVLLSPGAEGVTPDPVGAASRP